MSSPSRRTGSALLDDPPARLRVACLGAPPHLRWAVDAAAASLGEGHDWQGDELLTDITGRLRRYVGEHAPGLRIDVEHIESSLDGCGADVLVCFLGERVSSVAEVLAALASLPAGSRPDLSPYGVRVYGAADPSAPVATREMPADGLVLAADLLCALGDHVEARLVRPTVAGSAGHVRTLAAGLGAFLTARSGTAWGLHTYTGSVVSGVIADLESIAREQGNPVLRGPSEHALACGAMARWTLDRAPFLIVVTSGMIDEFRGTLANLRQAGARGFIVAADSPSRSWGPFQGTVHSAEDSRDVLTARRLRHRYLEKSRDLVDDLAWAYEAYDADDGPVVLLTTPTVLNHQVEPPPVPPLPAKAEVIAEDPLRQVAELVNSGPDRLLWQVGALPAEDLGLLRRVADTAGAALADTLCLPGSVPGFADGVAQDAYLGPLSIYGCSDRVHDFLHHDGKLRGKDEQSLFFLGNRIAEVDTPFSERALNNSMHVVQVAPRAADLAPFADLRMQGEVRTFLRRLDSLLDVEPDVLARRRAAIEGARATSDPVGAVPIRPMTMNSFIGSLGAVVESLIRDEGYRYTGVYDVGRGGIAAVRSIGRTDPGFSGWYGRALMGDALLAIPAIALTRRGNVLAFIGDGAAALVPDILPNLLQQLLNDGHRLRGNVSVFRLHNGSHSLIRTYQEIHHREPSVGQTTVFNLVDDDWERDFGVVRVRHRRLDDVDDSLRREITEPARVNLYSVMVSHNSEGDGITALSTNSWHHY